jgi:hypothetical protein
MAQLLQPKYALEQLWENKLELSGYFTGRYFVDIAPDPILAWLDGADERMLRLMEVLGGVLVLRRVAAADVAALQAQAQVNPAITHLHALGADMGVGCSELHRL